MAIYKNMDIKISNEQAMFNEKFYVYQNDRGIELHLNLDLSKTVFGSTRKRLLFSNNSIFVGATVLKPNGSVFGRDQIEMVDDVIRFVIDKELTDDIDEIGIYKIQFHLYDDENNRITIPPVQFEVKELIGIVEEPEVTDGVVDSARVNFSTVVEDENLIEIVSNGRYIKTKWVGGDLITAKKLNKIEEALEDLDTRLDDATTGGYYQVNSIQERDEIPLSKRKEGMLCYVKNDKIYQLLNGLENENWSVFYTSGKNIYVGEDSPESENIFVWIDTSDEVYIKDIILDI